MSADVRGGLGVVATDLGDRGADGRQVPDDKKAPTSEQPDWLEGELVAPGIKAEYMDEGDGGARSPLCPPASCSG